MMPDAAKHTIEELEALPLAELETKREALWDTLAQRYPDDPDIPLLMQFNRTIFGNQRI